MNCALALALLLDVSGSMQPEHWDAMRAGHAAALRAPAVVRTAETDGIAVAAWQFDAMARPSMDWRVLRSAADVESAAAAIDAMPRLGAAWTYTGSAVMDVLSQFAHAPCGDAQVVDVATDGRPNGGTPIETARDAAHAAGVRINVLLIGGNDDDADAMRDGLATPGGFVMHAATWGEFARAIQRKLATEIGAR